MPFLTLLDLLFGLFVISLVVNLTSATLPVHYVPRVMRWGWFSSLIYVTIRAMTTDSVQQWLRGTFRPSVASFLVAAILGALVGVVYWAIVSRIGRYAESQQTATTEQTPPPKTVTVAEPTVQTETPQPAASPTSPTPSPSVLASPVPSNPTPPPVTPSPASPSDISTAKNDPAISLPSTSPAPQSSRFNYFNGIEYTQIHKGYKTYSVVSTQAGSSLSQYYARLGMSPRGQVNLVIYIVQWPATKEVMLSVINGYDRIVEDLKAKMKEEGVEIADLAVSRTIIVYVDGPFQMTNRLLPSQQASEKGFHFQVQWDVFKVR